MTAERVIVGISGASGAALGVRILERLAALPDIETHLVVSNAARRTLALECAPDKLERLPSLVHHHHPVGDLTLTYEGLELTAEPGLSFLIYMAEPGSPSRERLELLASWAAPAEQQTGGRPRTETIPTTTKEI